MYIEFGYKSVYSQLTTTHYVSINKIIHVYFSHMAYLMSHVTFLNNICGWSYKLPHSGCSKQITNQFVAKPSPIYILNIYFIYLYIYYNIKPKLFYLG